MGAVGVAAHRTKDELCFGTKMRADDDITVEIVRRLFAVLGLPIAGARPLPEPSPDVEVTLLDGRTIVVEQTTFHVDEAASSKGSAIRGEDTRTVKANPGAWPSGGWAPFAFIEPFEFRVREKAKKSNGYARSRNQEIWLLVSAALPQSTSLRASFIFPSLVDPDAMNARTHKILSTSAFDRAYLHSELGNGLCSWFRNMGWQVEKTPELFFEGLDMLQALQRAHRHRP